MLSMPPARTSSASPARIAWAASITAFKPEPHTLLTVKAAMESGRPAFRAACRAGFWPRPAWRTQPMITSSTRSGGARRGAAPRARATAPSSGAGTSARAPRYLPIGVRTAERRKASDMRGLREGPTAGTGSVCPHYIIGPGTGVGFATRSRAGAVRQQEAAVRAKGLGSRNPVVLGRKRVAIPSVRAIPLSSVGGVVVNLTGRSRTREFTLRPSQAPECRLELAVLCSDFVGEAAVELTAGVAAGTVSPWQLGWAPLLRGGSESGIIETWRQAAETRMANEADRRILGFLTCTFAQLVHCRPTWERRLRRWNMQTSPFWDEIRAEGAREMLLRLGRRMFGRAPTRKQNRELDAVTDLARLEGLAERLLDVSSWADQLNGG